MVSAIEINPSSAVCDLCGLSLRYGNVTSTAGGKPYRFCCMGCRQVFHMLLEACGETDSTSFKETELFKRCQDMGIIPRSESDLEQIARPQRRSDSPRSGNATLSLNLRIGQMWCPACAWVIEEALRKNAGIAEASCNFSTDRVRCQYSPLITSPAQIIDTIDSLGYKASIPGEEAQSKEKRKEFIRFAISAFLTINVMMLSFALYSGFFTELSRDTIFKFSWPCFVMATIVLFYGGRNIYWRAFAGISSAGFSMETLITAGSFSAYLYSTYNLLSGSIHLYFDTASMLIVLVLLGKMLERRAKDEIQEDLGNFFSLRPTKVRICSDLYPEGRYVAPEQLEKGDIYRVEEGEVVPADGLIFEGTGSVDESSLTGEAVPIYRKSGDRVRSGTKVIQGSFKVKSEGVGENSILGQMIEIMESALERKTPLEGKTDVALQWFAPIILMLAVGTGLVCLLLGLSMEGALIRSITVMVISCPCALGIAIPLARVAGISLAGKKGILVRDFLSFEKARQLDAFVLDKTGTITEGQWALLDIIPLDPYAETQVLAMAASLEKASDHHIAMEIKRCAGKSQIQAVMVEGVESFENGISGRIGKQEVKIGSRVFLAKELGAFGPISTKSAYGNISLDSFVFMSFGGKPCAIFVFGDKIRNGLSRTIKQLRSMGHRMAIVSGDEQRTTEAIGKKVGVSEAYGGKLPQNKAIFIQELQNEGHRVAMVGDGINDALALARADLAIAVHSGSHLGKETADMTLMRGDPSQILDFLELAEEVNGKIRQNLVCSFFYNLLSIPIAMSGLLTPLVAVCAMLLSSLSVIGNTLLLIRKSRRSS